MEHINEELPLDVIVEWTIRLETRRVVNLKQHWLQLCVQNNIEAKQFKSHMVLYVCRLVQPVAVGKFSLNRDDSLDDDVLDVGPHSICILLILLQSLQQGSH